MTRTETPRRRHDVTAVTTTIRARIREARESRTRHRALWHELAQYTSADDLNDLEAAVARYDDDETHDIRRILAAQRALAG